MKIKQELYEYRSKTGI